MFAPSHAHTHGHTHAHPFICSPFVYSTYVHPFMCSHTCSHTCSPLHNFTYLLTPSPAPSFTHISRKDQCGLFSPSWTESPLSLEVNYGPASESSLCSEQQRTANSSIFPCSSLKEEPGRKAQSRKARRHSENSHPGTGRRLGVRIKRSNMELDTAHVSQTDARASRWKAEKPSGQVARHTERQTTKRTCV